MWPTPSARPALARAAAAKAATHNVGCVARRGGHTAPHAPRTANATPTSYMLCTYSSPPTITTTHPPTHEHTLHTRTRDAHARRREPQRQLACPRRQYSAHATINHHARAPASLAQPTTTSTTPSTTMPVHNHARPQPRPQPYKHTNTHERHKRTRRRERWWAIAPHHHTHARARARTHAPLTVSAAAAAAAAVRNPCCRRGAPSAGWT